MASPNVALPNPQQTNFPTNGNNGNNGNNANQAAAADNVVKNESTQTSNAVQANEKSDKSAAAENDRKHRRGNRHDFGAHETRGRRGRRGQAAKADQANEVAQVSNAKKAHAKGNKGGVTSAANEFTNALQKLESKGKIDLAGQDVNALSKRLADAFSSRGVNAKKLAKFMSKFLDSAKGDSFANNISNDSSKGKKADKAEKTAKDDDAAAPKNVIGGVAADLTKVAKTTATASVALLTQAQAPAPTAGPLAGGIDSSSLGVLQQSPKSGAEASNSNFPQAAEQVDNSDNEEDDTSVRAKAEADAKAEAENQRKLDAVAEKETVSVRELAEADAKAEAKANEKPDTAADKETVSVRELAEADAEAQANGNNGVGDVNGNSGNGNNGVGDVNGNGNNGNNGVGDVNGNSGNGNNGVDDVNGNSGTNLTGNNGNKSDDDIFNLAMSLFGAANERANENSNAALGAQNRGGLSGDNLIALQASDGKAGGNQKVEADESFVPGANTNGGEADKLAARLDQANSRVDADSGTAKVDGAKADNEPVATKMSDISSTILEDANLVADVDAQKVEQNESLMAAIDQTKEKEDSNKEKQEQNGGIASIAA